VPAGLQHRLSDVPAVAKRGCVQIFVHQTE
jgi:hypothetical protein